jgi:hypothetical protein
MNNSKDFDQLTKQTRKYEFLDGLVDITYGVVFLAIGLLSWFFFSSMGLRWFAKALVQNREITILGIVLLFSLLLLLVAGSQRIVQTIRQSKLWMQSGFVKPLRWQVRWPVQLMVVLISTTIILVSFGLMLAGYLSQEVVLRSLVFSIGIGTSLTFLGLGIDLAIKRYTIIGGCGIAVSVILISLPISFSNAWLLFGFSWMVFLTISGIWAFRSYTHQRKWNSNE